MPDPIQLLRDLVATPSVNPSDAEPDDTLFGEARVVDLLEAWFHRHRIHCLRQQAAPGRQNLIAVVEGTGPETRLLEAHTDTVSVEGMTIDPFDPRTDGERMWGRGSCDCKASLAAMATALVRVARAGRPSKTCLLAATCGEEYRFVGIKALVTEPQEVGLDLKPGAVTACVGEPTSLDVIIAHKGAFRWRMTTRGKAAHSSDPSQGDNAIYRMADLLHHLRAYADSLRDCPRHPLVGGPTFSVGVIRGGSAVNIVPDSCSVLVDRRLIPGERMDHVLCEVREFLGDRVQYEIDRLLEDWPLETPADAPITQAVAEAVRSVLGQARIGGVQFGTDASKLDQVGVPTVVCGPGDIRQAHTADEWVRLDQVEAAAKVYERLLSS
ncbi:MAG: M20 family metallopeptidase [Armatimonadia bacterium]